MSSPSQKPSLPRRSPKIQEALAARDDLAAALTTAADPAARDGRAHAVAGRGG